MGEIVAGSTASHGTSERWKKRGAESGRRPRTHYFRSTVRVKKGSMGAHREPRTFARRAARRFAQETWRPAGPVAGVSSGGTRPGNGAGRILRAHSTAPGRHYGDQAISR